MAATFLPFTTDLVTALGWAILHSLWQALLVFICLRIVLKLWPDATASTKYNLAFLSLAGIFSWFVVTLYQQLEVVRELQQVKNGMAAMEAAPPLVLHSPAVYQSQEGLNALFPNLELWFSVLVALYIAGVAVMCIKLVADLAQLQQIRKTQVLPADNAWEHYLDKLKQQLHIPRKVKLLISQYVQVPVMIGFLKPVILMPVTMFNNLGAEQLEAILLHELAHIKRNDYLLNIFQSIVETALFFNPFVWWISKYIRLEREHCCDDMVLAHTSQPLHYAKALVALEEYRFTTNSMAMAAADNKQHLFYRIKRIMEMKTTHLNYSQKFMAMLIIAVGLTAIAWITPSAKEDQRKKDQATASADASPAAAAAPMPVIQPFTDTVPPKVNSTNPQNSSNDKRENTSNDDADDAHSEEVDREMKKVHEQMRHVDQEMKKVHEQMRVAQESSRKAVQEAMKNIDWKAINAQTQEALKSVDWKKINQEIESSMKSIDWNKINQEINESMKEGQKSVDPEMIRKSVEMGMKSAQAALANIDLENIIKSSMAAASRGMDEANRALMHEKMNDARAKQRDAMRESRERMSEAREREREARKGEMDARRAEMNAKRESERAHATHKQYQELISKMAADNLIDTRKGYTIEKKNDGLYINGTKQPASVLDKYRSYLGAGKLTIKGEKDNLNVNVQD
jgi:beta-lactamase regulating signal transducer with metallopeptidase domain